jgi:hypothetical protein
MEITKKHIEELKKKAIKRGFIDGCSFKELYGNDVWTVKGNVSFEYDEDCLKLWADFAQVKKDKYKGRGYIVIFENGKWAKTNL